MPHKWNSAGFTAIYPFDNNYMQTTICKGDVMKKSLLIFFLFLSIFAFADPIIYDDYGFILFQLNTSELLNVPVADHQLDEIAKKLMQQELNNGQIHIFGYTAKANNEIDDIELSAARARKIAAELQARGVPSVYFAPIEAKGSTSEWGNNSNEEEQRLNRRVTILVKHEETASILPVPSEYNVGVSTNNKTIEQENKKSFSFPWWILLIIVLIILIVLFVIFILPHISIGLSTGLSTIASMPLSILNLESANKILIPEKIKNTFQKINENKPPKKWKKVDYDNAEGILTRRGPNGEKLTYKMYISRKGERVIIGSDGVKYYVTKDNGIKPFNDVPEFISKSGRPVLGKGYVGKEYSDKVFYGEKIVYDGNGKLVRWEGPIFDNVSKFDVSLPKELLKKPEAEQYEYVYKKLREWIKDNPEEAIRRFGSENVEKLKNGDTVGNAGYLTIHHTEEVGKLQIFSREIHQEIHDDIDGKHAHTGGMELWGCGR